MAVITKITTQQKNTDRYNIFLDEGDGEKFAFSVDEDVLIKFQLKKGMELDELTRSEIHYSDDIRKSYNSAIGFLAHRIRSEKEIVDYLLKKEVEEPVINEVLHKLKTQDYVNDQEFATAYVRTQINTTDKGPDVIRRELREKGITQELIQHCLLEFSFDLQVEKAGVLAGKFAKKNSKESTRVLKQKVDQFLVRKGYSFEVIGLAFEEKDNAVAAEDELEAIRYQGEKAQRKFAKYSGYEYKQKVKQTLYRKGFKMDLIEKFLEEQEES